MTPLSLLIVLLFLEYSCELAEIMRVCAARVSVPEALPLNRAVFVPHDGRISALLKRRVCTFEGEDEEIAEELEDNDEDCMDDEEFCVFV